MLVFSPYILYRISAHCHRNFRIPIKGTGLSKKQYNNFMDFQRACRLFFCPSITKQLAELAHSFFESFNRTFVSLYGAHHQKPYFHMLLHFLQNIKDFGPIYGTWCFSYERYKYKYLPKTVNNTNRKGHFESTIFKASTERSGALSYIRQFKSNMEPTHNQMLIDMASLKEATSISCKTTVTFNQSTATTTARRGTFTSCRPSATQLSDTIQPDKLDEDQYAALLDHYRNAYDQQPIIEDAPRPSSSSSSTAIPAKKYVQNVVYKAASIPMDGLEYRNLESNKKKSSQTDVYVQAFFKGVYGDTFGLYPDGVLFFFDHYVLFSGGQRILHHFFFCRWFRKAPGTPKMVADSFQTVEVWSNTYEPIDQFCILPTAKIHSQAVVEVTEKGAVVIPISKKMYL